MFRRIFFWTLTLTLLAACSPAAARTEVPVASQPAAAAPTAVPATQAATAITLTDGLNRSVTLTSPAQRVVSLAPSNTEILFAIGASTQVVGRDELSDFPAEAKSIASVGGSMGNFSTEQIVALKPDLVLASELDAPELVKSLEDLGLTVFSLPNPKSFEDLYRNLDVVGQLTGHDVSGLIDSLKARVAAVDSKIAPISARPLVFYELDGSDPLKPWTSGPGTFVDLLITRAGGSNVGANLGGDWVQISSEQLVKSNPDIILLGDALYGVTTDSVAARSGWSGIAAVKSHAIYPFDPDLATRPGPRLVDALEQMAKILHPDLFK